MYPCFTSLPEIHLKVDQRVQKNNSPGIHLNVSQKRYLFELFDLKSVLWQMLNCLYSETCIIYLWVSIISAWKVLHISCNMCTRDLPDMYALSPWALGIHIRQIPCAHVTTITYCIYENPVPFM